MKEEKVISYTFGDIKYGEQSSWSAVSISPLGASPGVNKPIRGRRGSSKNRLDFDAVFFFQQEKRCGSVPGKCEDPTGVPSFIDYHPLDEGVWSFRKCGYSGHEQGRNLQVASSLQNTWNRSAEANRKKGKTGKSLGRIPLQTPNNIFHLTIGYGIFSEPMDIEASPKPSSQRNRVEHQSRTLEKTSKEAEETEAIKRSEDTISQSLSHAHSKITRYNVNSSWSRQLGTFGKAGTSLTNQRLCRQLYGALCSHNHLKNKHKIYYPCYYTDCSGFYENLSFGIPLYNYIKEVRLLSHKLLTVMLSCAKIKFLTRPFINRAVFEGFLFVQGNCLEGKRKNYPDSRRLTSLPQSIPAGHYPQVLLRDTGSGEWGRGVGVACKEYGNRLNFAQSEYAGNERYTISGDLAERQQPSYPRNNQQYRGHGRRNPEGFKSGGKWLRSETFLPGITLFGYRLSSGKIIPQTKSNNLSAGIA